MATKPFTARAADFWNWFGGNEEKLSTYLADLGKYDGGEVTAFLSEGLNTAIDGIVFEAGGGNEVNLSPEGRSAACFLTAYLVSAMPEKFKEKWTFTPWKTPAPEGFAVGMFDTSISPEDVMVDVHHEEDSSGFAVVFYNETLDSLDEDDCYHLFYILLEATLGENICLSHIQGVQKAEAPEEGMMPLSALPAFIRTTLAAEGREVTENPCLSLTAYSMEPEESDVPRFDVITGYTSLPDLLDDYYSDDDDETPTCDFLEENGVKPGFVMYWHAEENPGDALETRNAIAEKLEKEVLGEAGSGREIGVLLGQACGTDCCYIDILLYDEEAFYAAAPSVLAAFGYETAFLGFRQGDDGRVLVSGDADYQA